MSDVSNTPYDDAFRTLLAQCRDLILPVLNETFGEEYDGRETIEFTPNEVFMTKMEGETEKRITDTVFKVIAHSGAVKKYHMECQSKTDNSMLIRMYEYDSQIALRDKELLDDRLIVQWPKSVILYLRSNSKIPDKLYLEIRTDKNTLVDEIPVLKMQDYDLEKLFQKKLLFLLPFYIFTQEKILEDCEKDEALLKELELQFVKLKQGLQELFDQGTINDYTQRRILSTTQKVLGAIAEKYTEVKKGVKDAMVGPVIMDDLSIGYYKGMEEGEARGEARGRAEGEARGEARGKAEGARGKAQAMALRLHEQGVPDNIIAKAAEVSLDTVQQWLKDKLI